MKGKAKVNFLAEGLMNGEYDAAELALLAKQGTVANQKIAMEALEDFSREHPFPMHDAVWEFLIAGLGSNDTTLKREAARLLVNCANNASKRLEDALPLVLKNLEHSSTVVRWSAAMALESIFKNNSSLGLECRELTEELVNREEKQSIRKILVRSLQYIR